MLAQLALDRGEGNESVKGAMKTPTVAAEFLDALEVVFFSFASDDELLEKDCRTPSAAPSVAAWRTPSASSAPVDMTCQLEACHVMLGMGRERRGKSSAQHFQLIVVGM